MENTFNFPSRPRRHINPETPEEIYALLGHIHHKSEIEDFEHEHPEYYKKTDIVLGWLNGSGVPSNEIGVNGNYYLNILTSDVYYKELGYWSIQTNIQGRPGEPGAPGISPSIRVAVNSPSQYMLDITTATGTIRTVNLKGSPFIYENFTSEQLEALKGPPGNPGTPGAPGRKGDAFTYADFTPEQLATITGTKIYRVQGVVPANTLGADGDWAHDTSVNSYVYYKQNGTWSLVNSNKGTKGDKGDAFTYEDFTTEQLAALKGDPGYTPIKGIDYNDGEDAISPVVTEKTNTSTEYILTITDTNGSFDTPNLKGRNGLDGEGSGDMLKIDYDADGDGIVDNAKKVNDHTVEIDVPSNALFTDTVYTHPASHSPSIILQDANNRFVTDAEKTAWNAKAAGTHNHTASQITDFDTEVGNNPTVTANTTARHTHTNGTLLGTYTQTEVNLADAVSKKHSHTNSTILNNTTASFLIADETKLDGIETGAQVNDIETIRFDGVTLPIASKIVNIPYPLKNIIYCNSRGTSLPATCAEGQNFLHTTEKKLYTALTTDTWDSGVAVVTGQIFICAGGTSTAAIYFMGSSSLVGFFMATTDIQDGTVNAVSSDAIYHALLGKSDVGHNHTASQITDFDTEVSNNTNVATNTTKLSGIASGAQVNVIETVQVNGTPLTPNAKTVNVLAMPASAVVTAFWSGTSAQYAAISPKISTTQYMLTD